MTDLNPKARALMQLGRGAMRATTADRERIEALLRIRLGSEALPHDSGVAHTSSNISWQAMAGIASGICILGAVALVALRPAANAPVAPRGPVVPTAQSAPVRPAADSCRSPYTCPGKLSHDVVSQLPTLCQLPRRLTPSHRACAIGPSP